MKDQFQYYVHKFNFIKVCKSHEEHLLKCVVFFNSNKSKSCSILRTAGLKHDLRRGTCLRKPLIASILPYQYLHLGMIIKIVLRS